MDTIRKGAAVLTAVVIVIGISGAIVWALAAKLIEPETALAFLGPTYGAAGTYLWMKSAAKDAADTALAQPGTDSEVPE